MATVANISGFKFQLGTTASPPVYSDVEEVLSIGGFGKTNELVNVTNFDSGLTQEYIAGLADGAELTVEANYNAANTQQANLIAAVDAGETRSFRVVNEAPSPDETFDFLGVCLSWTIEPSPTEQNRITFTVKITGDIT